MDISEIVNENTRRNLKTSEPYDPVTGEGAFGKRQRMLVKGCKTPLYIPQSLIDEIGVDKVLDGGIALRRARLRHDFEYWAATCATILDKQSSQFVKLRLNGPQRRVLGIMETMRQAGKPVRVVLLKARQWGGSTLVQMYMAWLQLVVRRNWNSVIIGHLQQTAAAIKAMYSRLLRYYPAEMIDGNGDPPRFEAFEGSTNVRRLSSTGSLVIMGSAMSEDAIRGFDIKLAHLSEVAFWRSSPHHDPLNVMRSVLGTVPRLQDTVVVLESTADGVGSFFHHQWLEAKAGRSAMTAVFVPWHEIEIYSEPVTDPARLWNELDGYERDLWDDGLTLEKINWYHNKRREYSSHSQMKAEFPGNDVEAFTTTGYNVFDLKLLDKMRDDCKPAAWQGDIVGNRPDSPVGNLIENENGCLSIWKMPEKTDATRRHRYIVAVDVGGRSDDSDFSVIAVLDRHAPGKKIEVVAQWRGHIDHDLLTWKALQISSLYNNALLVIESNTLETSETNGVTGDVVMQEIALRYPSRLYFRRTIDPMGQLTAKPGFHTNTRTKPTLITNLILYVRDRLYIERDLRAIDELATYEQRPGSRQYAARRGCHDDILMTRAIALYVIREITQNEPKLPRDNSTFTR